MLHLCRCHRPNRFLHLGERDLFRQNQSQVPLDPRKDAQRLVRGDVGCCGRHLSLRQPDRSPHPCRLFLGRTHFTDRRRLPPAGKPFRQLLPDPLKAESVRRNLPLLPTHHPFASGDQQSQNHLLLPARSRNPAQFEKFQVGLPTGDIPRRGPPQSRQKASSISHRIRTSGNVKSHRTNLLRSNQGRGENLTVTPLHQKTTHLPA